jgi:hypothetical protein
LLPARDAPTEGSAGPLAEQEALPPPVVTVEMLTERAKAATAGRVRAQERIQALEKEVRTPRRCTGAQKRRRLQPYYARCALLHAPPHRWRPHSPGQMRDSRAVAPARESARGGLCARGCAPAIALFIPRACGL